LRIHSPNGSDSTLIIVWDITEKTAAIVAKSPRSPAVIPATTAAITVPIAVIIPTINPIVSLR